MELASSLNGSTRSLLSSAPTLTLPYISVIGLASVVGTLADVSVDRRYRRASGRHARQSARDRLSERLGRTPQRQDGRKDLHREPGLFRSDRHRRH